GTHPPDVGRRAGSRGRFALSGVAAAADSGVGFGGVGAVGEQPEGTLLPADQGGPYATGSGAFRIQSCDPRDRASDPDGLAGGVRRAMLSHRRHGDAETRGRGEGNMNGFWRRLSILFRRGRVDRDLEEEMRFHLEMKAQAGGGTEEARYKAQREFGNLMLTKETSREMWGWVWLETLVQDLRYGARMLRKDPGFTFVATATLALGIAVNSSIFSVISGCLLNKPAVEDPDRVVAVVSTNAARSLDRQGVSAVDFQAWRRANHVFADLAAVDPYRDFSLTGAGEPERITGMRVTANYFGVLGVPTFLGRTFLAGEDQPGRDHVVALAYSLWRRRFASDPKIIGKTVRLDGEKYVVIGVLPASFRQVAFLPRLWTPLVLASQDPKPNARDARDVRLFGRLKRGADLQRARAD